MNNCHSFYISSILFQGANCKLCSIISRKLPYGSFCTLSECYRSVCNKTNSIKRVFASLSARHNFLNDLIFGDRPWNEMPLILQGEQDISEGRSRPAWTIWRSNLLRPVWAVSVHGQAIASHWLFWMWGASPEFGFLNPPGQKAWGECENASVQKTLINKYNTNKPIKTW